MILVRLITLALATFAVGTAELVIAGILPSIAGDLGVSVEAVGWLVTIYAVVFAVGGPLLSGLGRRFDRRNLLIGGLLLFVTGNLLAVLTSSYFVILLSRVVAACGSAITSAQVLSAAAGLVPVSQRGKALAIAFAGFSGSAVLGVPLGTFIGQNFGWRMTFGLVIGLSLMALGGIRLLLPTLPPQPQTSPTGWTHLLGQSAILTTLLVSLLTMTGQYVLYTYLAPFLSLTARLSGNEISLVLLVYGLVGTLGNLLGGYLVDRTAVLVTLAISLVLTALPLIALGLVGTSFLAVLLITAVWGIFAWGFAPIQQYRLLELAPPRFGDLVVSLNLSVFNLGIAAGSAIGGLVISSGGLSNLGLVAGLIVAPAILVPVIGLLRPSSGKFVPEAKRQN